jgi:hypothetical protein
MSKSTDAATSITTLTVPRSSPWTLLSWLTPFVATGLVAFLFTSSIGQGQSKAFSRARIKSILNAPNGMTATPQIERQLMVCTISSFFSIDANEQVADTIHIEGRGLASCKSEQSETSEIPVFAVIDAKAVGRWANAGEISFSANSATFVIPRELAQIQDKYLVRALGSEVSDRTAPSLLVEGTQNGIVIEFRLSSSTEALRKLEITAMTLHFDENAPTLD